VALTISEGIPAACQPVYRLRMKIFEQVSPWSRLLRVTRAVFNTFDSIFKPFSAVNLREKFRSDEFVIAYMYGVMTHFFDF
jgi:hypothetical protein